jgi:hypothetical protein
MKPTRVLLPIVLAAAFGLAACESIEFPAPSEPAGAPVASSADNADAARKDVEKRQRRLARKRDKACEKHPERCED